MKTKISQIFEDIVTNEPVSLPENPRGKMNPVNFNYLKEFMNAGRSQGKIFPVNEMELNLGIEIEMEHTTNRQIAEKIARDHLAEIPDYYTRLKKMEAEAKQQMGEINGPNNR